MPYGQMMKSNNCYISKSWLPQIPEAESPLEICTGSYIPTNLWRTGAVFCTQP